MNWAKEILGTEKPIIAMCHLRALPGDSQYDEEKGMDWVVQMARNDLMALQSGGVDAVMFSNEFSLPYLKRVEPVTTAAMGRIIGELKSDIKVPFGVNVLWDPYASIDLAAATGALFIREVMSGVYAGDLGLWDNDAGAISRHRKKLGLPNLKMLYNIYPEAAAYISARSLTDIARTNIFNNQPDALLVSGITAGERADIQLIRQVKEVAGDTYVFCNTGCTNETVEGQLSVADGAIVGTAFKKDGVFNCFVDEKRVSAFMKTVRSFRKSLQ